MIVIATHAVFLQDKDVYGPPHAASLYLNKKKIDHIFIKHRLEGDGYSRVEYFRKGKLVETVERGFPQRKRFFLQYFYEILLTIKIVFKDAGTCEVFIGVDPLNALAGYILKHLGKAKKIVYFSADFALVRFDNTLLNKIYLSLDSFAMFHTNYTWSISKRIITHRRKKGLENRRNLILPNAPFFNDVKRKPLSAINKHELVIVAKLSEGIAFTLLFDAIAKIKYKIQDIRLLVIGSGEKEAEFKQYVDKKNLSKQIIFLGPKTHEKMFEVLTSCAVGIAFYNFSDKNHYHYYSDSMKVRDYLASGLPSLISGNSGIVEEVEKNNAGRHVDLVLSDMVKAIQQIITNEKKYIQMRNNAIKLAEQYDTFALLEKYFSLLNNSYE